MSPSPHVDSGGGFPAVCRRRSCWIGVGAGILTVFLGITFFLSTSIENSVQRRFSFQGAQQDEESAICHPLWGDASRRVDELNRILASVRSELSTAAEKLDESNRELEAVTRVIPNKKLELQDIQRQIEEARRVQREINDRRNVRVFLPREPLWPVETRKMNLEEQSPNLEALLMEVDFDYSRCSITAGFRFYLYPTNSENLIHEGLSVHQGRIQDPSKACVFIAVLNDGDSPDNLEFWNGDGRNHLIIPLGQSKVDFQRAFIFSDAVYHHQSAFRNPVFLQVPKFDEMNDWKRYTSLLPHNRTVLIAYKGDPSSMQQLEELRTSANNSGDLVEFSPKCDLKNAVFSLIFAENKEFHRLLYDSLLAGAIPVVLDADVVLPFDDLLDWRLISVRIAKWRFTELHFILRSIPIDDILEMRRVGRVFLEKYLGNARALSKTVISAISTRIGLPPDAFPDIHGTPLFNNSFVAPQISLERKPTFEEEFLGPVEAPSDSPRFVHNFTSLGMYSYLLWNRNPSSVHNTPPYSMQSPAMPSEAELYPETNSGFRPISPGSGKEFSEALGGNRGKEQFTIVMVTYSRDAVLAASLERLRDLPYLNKVVVVWNNIDRDPPLAWPRIHVPIEFVRAKRNSLNNRFIPYANIQTEAVLSMDDDIDLKQHEIIIAFRKWREQRSTIVGFPARYHARYDDHMYYNSNHTCQYSMILTGAAFLHHSFLHEYSHNMHAAIRAKVDELMNCEDIAMAFLVADRTREAPIKVTSKWTFRCPNCTGTLSNNESHFAERHECIRFFTRVYGYNPLLNTQFRADSVLFKTRLPATHQKCFKYV